MSNIPEGVIVAIVTAIFGFLGTLITSIVQIAVARMPKDSTAGGSRHRSGPRINPLVIVGLGLVVGIGCGLAVGFLLAFGLPAAPGEETPTVMTEQATDSGSTPEPTFTPLAGSVTTPGPLPTNTNPAASSGPAPIPPPVTTNSPELYADLVIENVIYSPEMVLENRAMIIRVIIKNQGNTASAATSLQFEWVDSGDTQLWDINSLPPGSTHELALPYQMPGGNQRLRFSADVNNLIGESNEGNNVFDGIVTVHAIQEYYSNWVNVNRSGCADLDQGVTHAEAECPDANIDFTWGTQLQGKDLVHFLQPGNSASFAIYGTTAPDIVDCMNADLKTDWIEGGAYNINVSTYFPTNLDRSVYVCYQTSTGRFGRFSVIDYGGDGGVLTISVLTWQIN